LLAVAVALVPTSHARLDTPANERGSRNILLPERGIYLGAFVGGSEDRPYQNVLDFEALIGRKLQIDNHYYGWPATFPGEWEGWDAAHGRIPMATWDGAPLDEIVSGRWDTLIRDRARAVKAFGGPLFLRFAAEMNGDWLPWSGAHNGRDPRKYVLAWRRAHGIFREEGALNAVWVWSVNHADFPREPWNLFTRYYPGDDYVDWVGIDGFNWGATREWSSWEGFDSLFGRAYRAFAGRKPLMIAEVSSAESGGNKGAWIMSAARALKARFPAVRALVWFHIDKETDWRIDSSPSALRSFRVLAADPYFRARPSSPRD
jgi:hypothetical protein